MVPAFVLLSAVMLQTISAQCLGPYGPGLPGPGLPAAAAEALAYGPGLPGPGPLGPGLCNGLGVAPTSGGGFMTTSSSPISPTGLSVQTDSLVIEGPLAVSGLLPFLGTVALEGPLPIAGAGSVAYGCGTGNVGILNEIGGGPAAPAYGPYGPEMGCGPYGYNGFPGPYGPGRGGPFF